MKIDWKKLVVSIVPPLAIGGVSALVTKEAMDLYENVNQPPLSPPMVLFPIVWTILFLLMGISFYIIWTSDVPTEHKRVSYALYWIQLAVNFVWPIIFFNMSAYLFAFVWLVILWLLVLLMMVSFSKISLAAAYIQLPYLLWLTFAGYLNIMVYLLN